MEQNGLLDGWLLKREVGMSRRKTAERRPIDADERFGSVLVSKFTNGLMERGKKSIAQRIFYDAMDIVTSKVQEADALTVFEEAMERSVPRSR